MKTNYDTQGRFLGMPYDWRLPPPRKVLDRIYRPGGPLFPPKSFGMGWTLNLAHPASGWIVAGFLALGLTLVIALG